MPWRFWRLFKPIVRAAEAWGMKPRQMLASIAMVLFSLTGCGPAIPDKIEGSYSLAGDAFVDAGVKALQESDRLPKGMEAMAAGLLREIKMDLDLKPDGSFTCRMRAQGKEKDYRGTWTQTGDDISLSQTHEGDEEKSDSMQGKIEGRYLKLIHMEKGKPFPYVLERSGSPAAPGK